MTELQGFIASRTPPGWETRPLWSLFRRRKLTGYADEELLSVYRDYGVIPKSSRDDNYNKESDDLSGYQLVTEGSLVTNKMKAWQGSIAISRYRGIVSPAYYVYEPLSEEWDQFLHYLLRSAPYISLYGRISKGVRVNQWDLEHDALRNVPVMLPDLDTQKAIADFLDRETARIDQLIEKKQRLVELLEEREQNNLMRVFAELSKQDSCWKISHICLLQRGRFNHRPRNAPELYDGKHPFLQTGDVARAKKFIRAHKQTLTDLGASVSARFPKGTVLMAIAANVGDVAISKFDAFCPDSVVGFVPFKQVDKEFLYYALRSLRPSIATSSTSNAQDNTNIARLGALKIPLPELSVQRQIVVNLDHAETQNNALADVTIKSIERLNEFRSALITAAVTGQIDVLTWSKKRKTDRHLDQIEEDSAKEAIA